jgi:hypothetical protein
VERERKRRTYTEVDRARMQAMVANRMTRKQMEKDFDKVPPEAEMLRLLSQGAPKKKREPQDDPADGPHRGRWHPVSRGRSAARRRSCARCASPTGRPWHHQGRLGALRDMNTFEDDTVGQ